MMKRAAPGTDADEDSCEGHRRAELANRWSKKMKMDDGGEEMDLENEREKLLAEDLEEKGLLSSSADDETPCLLQKNDEAANACVSVGKDFLLDASSEACSGFSGLGALVGVRVRVVEILGESCVCTVLEGDPLPAGSGTSVGPGLEFWQFLLADDEGEGPNGVGIKRDGRDLVIAPLHRLLPIPKGGSASSSSGGILVTPIQSFGSRLKARARRHEGAGTFEPADWAAFSKHDDNEPVRLVWKQVERWHTRVLGLSQDMDKLKAEWERCEGERCALSIDDDREPTSQHHCVGCKVKSYDMDDKCNCARFFQNLQRQYRTRKKEISGIHKAVRKNLGNVIVWANGELAIHQDGPRNPAVAQGPSKDVFPGLLARLLRAQRSENQLSDSMYKFLFDCFGSRPIYDFEATLGDAAFASGTHLAIEEALYNQKLEEEKEYIAMAYAFQQVIPWKTMACLHEIGATIEVALSWNAESDEIGAMSTQKLEGLRFLVGEAKQFSHTLADLAFVKRVYDLVRRKEALLRHARINAGHLSVASAARPTLCAALENEKAMQSEKSDESVRRQDSRIKVKDLGKDFVQRIRQATFEEMRKLGRLYLEDPEAFEEKARLCCFDPKRKEELRRIQLSLYSVCWPPPPHSKAHRDYYDHRSAQRLKVRQITLETAVEDDDLASELANCDTGIRNAVFFLVPPVSRWAPYEKQRFDSFF